MASLLLKICLFSMVCFSCHAVTWSQLPLELCVLVDVSPVCSCLRCAAGLGLEGLMAVEMGKGIVWQTAAVFCCWSHSQTAAWRGFCYLGEPLGFSYSQELDSGHSEKLLEGCPVLPCGTWWQIPIVCMGPQGKTLLLINHCLHRQSLELAVFFSNAFSWLL